MTDREEDSEAAAIQAIQSIFTKAMSEAHAVIKAATSAAREAAAREAAARETAAASAADTKQPDEDLPPHDIEAPYYVSIPESLPRNCAPNGLAAPYASIAKIGSPQQTADSSSQVWQRWDVYGDTYLFRCTSYPEIDCIDRRPTIEVLGRAFAPPIDGRAKLTREYQEIMWAVAPVMDASFLRPIFDKYHPRAEADARLTSRRNARLTSREAELDAHKVELDAREAELDAREGNLDAGAAELREQIATLDAGVVRYDAELDAHKYSLAAHKIELDAREAKLREQIAALDAAMARHDASVVEFAKLQTQLRAQRDQRESALRDALHEANPDKYAMLQTLNAQSATIITLKATIRKVADKLLLHDPHAHESVNKYAAELFNAIADRVGK